MKKITHYLYIFLIVIVIVYIKTLIYAQLDPTEKKGLLIIQNLRTKIQFLQEEMTTIEQRVPSIHSLQQIVQEKEKQLDILKKQHAITTLEDQIKAQQQIIDHATAEIYAKTNNSYNTINTVLKEDIYDNRNIQAAFNGLINQLATLNNMLQEPIRKIREQGNRINQLTKEQQSKIKQAHNTINTLKQTILNRIEASQAVQKFLLSEQEIINLKITLQQSINNLIGEEKTQLDKLKNNKLRFELMLQFLQNPASIQTISPKNFTDLLMCK